MPGGDRKTVDFHWDPQIIGEGTYSGLIVYDREFDDSFGWGYNPAYMMAVDKYYGPADDPKAFINAAHEQGIAVIFDLVLNHAMGQHPLIKLFTLGDGFVTEGGEVKVTHMGFLGQVYNNDGITPRKVGVLNYIGELTVLDPVTGEKQFLFRNQIDWITHGNDSGKVISLGIFPKGAPIVFVYVNVDGKKTSYKTFSRCSGDNVVGTYDFNAGPVLKNLAIYGKPKPVSGGLWNWEGKNHILWAVAASVPGTDEKQFHFEDADDRIFNDIVFRVSGLALTSETFQFNAL